MNSNRFEFTSVTGLSLHSVYMTSPEVKLPSPENEDILLFCVLKVNLILLTDKHQKY